MSANLPRILLILSIGFLVPASYHLGHHTGYKEGEGIGYSNGAIAVMKCQKDPSCFTAGPVDLKAGETWEGSIVEVRVQNHLCSWKDRVVVGSNVNTCVPRTGVVIARTWEEIVAVGADPKCAGWWKCPSGGVGENMDAWDRFEAGMDGLDWYLPGEVILED